MRSTVGVTVFLAMVGCGAAQAAGTGDRFHVTALERAACGYDAYRLCASAYPDEDRLLACMKSNRDALGSACRPVFEAGLKRRHL